MEISNNSQEFSLEKPKYDEDIIITWSRTWYASWEHDIM